MSFWEATAVFAGFVLARVLMELARAGFLKMRDRRKKP